MKKVFRSLMSLFFFVGFAQNVFAQSEVISRFEVGLKAANSKALVKEFNESIELNIEGNKQSVNKTASEGMLNDFFSKYPLVSFAYIHKGAVGDSGYAVGKYDYNGGTFRVVVKTEGEIIKKLDITKD